MTIKDENESSPIKQIQEEKEKALKIPKASPLNYIEVPKPVIMMAGILFVGMLITIISLFMNQASTKEYAKILDIEELIQVKDFNKAEELCYGLLYSENKLSAYSEGALLRIAGEYAALGDHKKSKVVLERVVSTNPMSFIGRTSLVITSALSGDVTGMIKHITDVPNITAYIPGIHTMIKDFTVGNTINSKGIIEVVLKMLLNK